MNLSFNASKTDECYSSSALTIFGASEIIGGNLEPRPFQWNCARD